MTCSFHWLVNSTAFFHSSWRRTVNLCDIGGLHVMPAQALADYAALITDLKHEWKSPDSAVIGFGGSYGGMLASWFRMKYPNVLDGECLLGCSRMAL